ncbi:MAG: lipoyl synthase [Phycisphaerae bacterium]|nr:lipoyl synthase [Phycisphaerae bacterium]
MNTMNDTSNPLPIVDPPKRQRRLPAWLKRPMPVGDAMLKTRALVNGLRLNTVCVEARCPNLTECWTRGTATFMILGDLCTRSCKFCAVTTRRPLPPEADEPERLAAAAAHLKLRHVVITSVARDDLPDEGAGHFAACILKTREKLPQATIEVLVPDFHAKRELIKLVTDARPEVYNHNLETVARLQKPIRQSARYQRSLDVLRIVKETAPELRTKSGLMVGLGETRAELSEAMRDLHGVGCELLTIGQYLRPGPNNTPVERYYPPEEFEELADEARKLGFSGVASGPFVRSSYFAESLYAETGSGDATVAPLV